MTSWIRVSCCLVAMEPEKEDNYALKAISNKAPCRVLFYLSHEATRQRASA